MMLRPLFARAAKPAWRCCRAYTTAAEDTVVNVRLVRADAAPSASPPPEVTVSEPAPAPLLLNLEQKTLVTGQYGSLRTRLPFSVRVRAASGEGSADATGKNESGGKTAHTVFEVRATGFPSEEVARDYYQKVPLRISNALNESNASVVTVDLASRGVSGADKALDGILEKIPGRFLVDVTVPVKFSVELTSRTGDVSVEGVEGPSVRIVSAAGSVRASRVKTDLLKVQTLSGPIELGTVHCNADLSTETGALSIGKVQGQTVDVRTGAGNVGVRALYAENSSFVTQSGEVRLGNIHGNVSVVSVKGPVSIGGVDGTLVCTTDDAPIDVGLVRPDRVQLTTAGGAVTVGIPADLHATLHIRARNPPDISGDDLISAYERVQEPDRESPTGTATANINGGGSHVHVNAVTGSVKLVERSWFQGLDSKLTKLPGVGRVAEAVK